MTLDNEVQVKYPSQPPPISDGKNPHVMIVGAGLAGLLLGILLDKAGIPYQIYERAKEVKPLGMSVLSILSPIRAHLLRKSENGEIQVDQFTYKIHTMSVVSTFRRSHVPECRHFPRPGAAWPL